MTFLQIIRVIFGSIYVLFIPGFILTFLFYNKREINWLERIILSMAISIAAVPTLIFFINLIFGIKITTFNVVMEIFILILLSAGGIYFRYSEYYEKFSKKISKLNSKKK
jgi:uncharacterized membrane protein